MIQTGLACKLSLHKQTSFDLILVCVYNWQRPLQIEEEYQFQFKAENPQVVKKEVCVCVCTYSGSEIPEHDFAIVWSWEQVKPRAFVPFTGWYPRRMWRKLKHGSGCSYGMQRVNPPCDKLGVWLVIYLDSTCVLINHSPGLRGSHTLRIGSEPPAATSAEPSPPTSTVFRAFPEYYNLTKTNWL